MRILSKMLQSMIKRAPKSEPEAGYLSELKAVVLSPDNVFFAIPEHYKGDFFNGEVFNYLMVDMMYDLLQEYNAVFCVHGSLYESWQSEWVAEVARTYYRGSFDQVDRARNRYVLLGKASKSVLTTVYECSSDLFDLSELCRIYAASRETAFTRENLQEVEKNHRFHIYPIGDKDGIGVKIEPSQAGMQEILDTVRNTAKKYSISIRVTDEESEHTV